MGSLKPEPLFFCPLCRFEGERKARSEEKSESGTKSGTESGSRAGSRNCAKEAHSFVTGGAAVRAGAEILSLVHRFKYSGQRELAPLLARLILDSGIVDENFRGFQLMCPVPLFRTRLRERGFNQSEDIAVNLEKYSGVPVIPDILSKLKPTAEQAKLAGSSRRRNLLGSFVVARPGVVSGKSVVLVDDVITTGSTVAACIEALRTSNVSRVFVVAIAA